ncbi:MAG: hypothetical protein JXQ75_21195 [Phycisphaerae bacterium]|nr:hypothetical protein [Phycisphaerae bacterium]
MARRITQFVVYTKVTFVCLVLVAIGLLIVKNWGYKTRFWPGAAEGDVPTLWLILASSVISVVLFWILSRMRRVYAELKELRSEQAEQKRQAEREKRQKELDNQERRIDDKIRRALERDESEE